MADQDPIDEFIALPREQQLSTLKGLSPEKQDKLLGKVKERKNKPKAPAQPAPGPSAASRFLSSAGGAISDAASGLWHTATAPATAEEAGTPGGTPGLLMRRLIAPQVEQGKQAVEAARTPGFWGNREAQASAVGHGLAAITPGAGPWAAQVGEQVGGQIGERDYAGAAGTVAGNAALYAAPKAIGAAGRTIARTAPAVRSVFGAGDEPLTDAATRAAEDANSAAEAAKAHNKAADEKTLADRGHVDEQNATQLRKEAEERKKVNAQRRDALRAHDTKTAEVRGQNEAAVAEQEKAKALPGKIKTAYRDLQAQVETARNNALKEGNEKYNGVNEALSHEQANLGTIQDGVHEALGMIQGTQVSPAIIESIRKQMNEAGAMDYSDLQGYYSELGREISKGNLPGDLYQAYNKMHEAIGEDMQRIADANGQGQQLTDARNYWRRMKQTFGKPYNPTDAATATTEKAAPGVASAEEQANRIRMIASFDPTVTQTFDHIQNLQSGLDALPKPAPLRDVVKPLPERPKLPEVPKPDEPRQYPEPRGQKPIERPEVSVRGIHEANVEAKMRQWKTLSRYQVGALLGGAVGVVTEMLSGRGLGAEASTAVGTATFALGPMALAKLAENPMVREWITRPQPGQVEALARVPYADRIKITDAMSKVVEQAAKSGNPIPVAPSVAALLGSAQSKGPAPRAKHPSDAWSEDGR